MIICRINLLGVTLNTILTEPLHTAAPKPEHKHHHHSKEPVKIDEFKPDVGGVDDFFDEPKKTDKKGKHEPVVQHK